MTVPHDAPVGSDERSGSQADGPPDQPERPHRGAPLTAPEVTSATCPYLSSVGGAWRQATPSRDHRCAALDPPTPQPTEKQRRHCLSADHVDCPIFRAARTARAVALVPSGDPVALAAIDAARRPIARTAPVLLEQPRLVDQAARLPFDRGPGQLALVALMILAFTVVAITRLSGPPAASPSAAPSVIVDASPSATPTPTPSPSVVPSESAVPASAEPSFRTTYTVKKGDTLSTIAARYKTTAAAIRQLNNLTSSTLHAGQVLKIP